ncbi:putative membrane protein (plasmid) [Acetobacter orientalis]|uniref:Putative membrane protein n=1 Tax=Acetobacter orientalis TaxID=146474 RepID=A0A2Z5ZN88_9PROT|nr:putative membrane protein [Acetobacter orientalis]
MWQPLRIHFCHSSVAQTIPKAAVQPVANWWRCKNASLTFIAIYARISTMKANDTSNQHFLAQADQRLNALNPHAREENQRIYSFKIANRENYLLELENPKGNLIKRNLSLFDLFSFDVLDDKNLRYNFELLFQKYEGYIKTHTKTLLAKLNAGDHDVKDEIIDLFTAKLINFVRNPFCIQKVINTFPGIASYYPTDRTLFASYRRIVNGKKPHQEYLCRTLGINDLQYIEWLRLLFMLLTPMSTGYANFFEGIIKSLLEDRKNYIAAFVCEYEKECCLLSDRGFSQPIENDAHMGFSFNLCSTAFVHYFVCDPAVLLKNKAHPEFLAYASAAHEKLCPPQINVTFRRNDLNMLAQYNRRVVEQCYERVFCAAKSDPILFEPRLETK